jgi:hypothetical protein
VKKVPQNNGTSEKLSRYNLGLAVFGKIIELMDVATRIGHKARKRYKDRTIIEYLGIIETLYTKVEPVLLLKDKGFIEDELKSLKLNIDAYNNQVTGNKVDLVNRLTTLERKFYNAIQNINMYIQLKADYTRASKKIEFKEHLEGSEIPNFDDDDEEEMDS